MNEDNFMVEDVKTAIRELKRATAPGPDDLPKDFSQIVVRIKHPTFSQHYHK